MRLKEFQKELRRQKIGLALFFNFDGDNIDPNLLYFTQYSGFGALAVTPNKAILVVPKAEVVRARKTSLVRVVGAKDRVIKTIKQTLKIRPRRVGIDKNRVSVNFYKILRKEIKAGYVDVSSTCLRLRTIKTSREIAIYRQACKITDEIMHKTFWNFKRFKTEADVAEFMRSEVGRRGLELAFKTIVASGGNASEAHHLVEDKKLKKGFCVIDFGVRYKGYCSDMTRTVYIGNPSRKEVEMYYKVLSVQEELIRMCVAGASFVKIDSEARRLFGKQAEHFTHLIGHGIGTEIHESPNPKKTPKRPVTVLSPGCVLTIEPGLYYDRKSGIRIEDDILVTSKGPQVLTKTGKNLLIVNRK